MKTTTQPTLPGVRDWSEPLVIPCGELGRAVIEGAGAGFEAFRMEVLPNAAGYRVHFQRMTSTAQPTRRAFASYAELSQPPDS